MSLLSRLFGTAKGLATRAFDRLDKRQFERERDELQQTARQVRAEMEARVQRELERRQIPQVTDELRQRVVRELEARGALGQPEQPEAEIPPIRLEGAGGDQIYPSSTIRNYSYDKNTGDLMVQFHKGGLYKYSGVPGDVFQEFADGNHEATTDGSNEFGEWWKGKNPSLGSAHWAYIRDNFPYQKVA